MTLPSLRTAVTAALVAAFAASGAVLAQAPSPAPAPGASGMPMHGPGAKDPRDMRGRWQERHDKHMADLKKDLQVTADQEGAWTQFTTAMRPPATPPQRPDRDAMARMTTPERIDQMRSMRQQRQAEMDRRADATKAFYATLTPEQKKKFDAHTARYMNGHRHDGGGREGHRGHHRHHG